MAARILFVNYSTEWTGPTKSLYLLLTRLKGDYELAVLAPGGGPLVEVLARKGIRFHRFPPLDKWSIPAAARLISCEEYDAVYANNTHGSSRNAFLAAKLARRPFVCHVRGMGWKESWLRLGYLRFADAVVAVSRECADSVQRFVRRGRLHVVHNGVPLEPGDSSADGTRVRAELGLDEDAVLALSLSHICPRKGQIHAVEAVAGVIRDGWDVHLCLAGHTDRNPDYTGRVRELARALGIEDRVHLVGFRSDISGLLDAAGLFVHSAVEDPHPRAVIEAMAASLPVVAFGVDGVAETVENHVTGLLVENGDADELGNAMKQIIRRPDALERMGAVGRDRVETHFTAEATARGVRRVLDEVLAESGTDEGAGR